MSTLLPLPPNRLGMIQIEHDPVVGDLYTKGDEIYCIAVRGLYNSYHGIVNLRTKGKSLIKVEDLIQDYTWVKDLDIQFEE
ncbi:MAG: hypothetical protein KAS32_19445 [Candidatus Peribacteraceae bacterium]|nr:hypothetical protein [Candidatus Peribacteraceae bacterium]